MQKFAAVGLVMLGWVGSSALAQKAAREVPLLSAGTVPLYPRMSLAARVQGVVKIRVTTDGKKVSSVEAESGPPMLVAAAKESILAWQFETHKPTTFETTFEYVIEEPAECYFSNSVAVLKLPLEVRISTKGLKTCDPAAETKPRQ
jgi:hypothetical protein